MKKKLGTEWKVFEYKFWKNGKFHYELTVEIMLGIYFWTFFGPVHCVFKFKYKYVE
jgi:hypothetical protein